MRYYKTGNDYLDNIGEGTEGLREVGAELNMLSRAFFVTGNEIMGESLIDLAHVVSESIKTINDAVGRDIDREYKKSQEQLGETLGLVFGAMNKDLEDAIKEMEDKE